MYQSLYRRFRPHKFSEVMGQEHIVKTLKNQIKMGRISHAYLFCGTRGTGKTSVAKIFAKAVNCLNTKDGEPCETCDICTSANNNSLMDIIEIDAASNNSVDDIRELRSNVIFAPSKCRYKVYIIDEVHMLSMSAFNALLKTLEEPPSHVIFILATTEPNKLPATILSRCERFDFKRIPAKVITKNLKNICSKADISIEDKAISMIARSGNGSMRDAISILEQCASYNDETLKYEDVCDILGTVNDDTIYDLVKSINNKDANESLKQIDKLMIYGIDIGNLIKSIINFLRDVVIYITCNDNYKEILDDDINGKKSLAAEFGKDFLMNALDKFVKLQGEIRYSQSPRVLLEITILKLVNSEISPDISSMLNRIEVLEKKLNIIEDKNITIVKNDTDISKDKQNDNDYINEKEIIDRQDNNTLDNKKDNKVKIDIKDIWDKAIKVIKKERPILSSLMNYGKPYFKNNEIVVEYSEDVYVKELSKLENKDYIKSVLNKVSNMEFILKFQLKNNDDKNLLNQVKSYFGDVEIID